MKKILIIIFLLIGTNVFAAENQKLNFTVEKFESAKKKILELKVFFIYQFMVFLMVQTKSS